MALLSWTLAVVRSPARWYAAAVDDQVALRSRAAPVGGFGTANALRRCWRCQRGSAPVYLPRVVQPV